jgi:hypothetical protein
VFGGISIKVNKLIVAVLGLSLLFIGCGSATDHYGNANYGGMSSSGPHDDHNLNHDGHGWNHNGYDWLSGGSYWYPSTYNYNYYTPYNYNYYTPYNYNYYTPLYTEPVYYNMPVVYHNWDVDPWWGANIYGFGSTYYYSSSSHWNYNGGYGFGDP